MACNQTLNGLVNDCLPSMGGIVEAYIIPWDSVTDVTVMEGQITAVTLAASTKFKKYYFKPGSSSFTSTLNVDNSTGMNYVSTDITLLFPRMDTTKRVEVAALSVTGLAMIVKDGNGLYWYFGQSEPVMASAGDGQTGAARSDANRYSITLQDNNPTWPMEVLVGEGGVDLSEIVG